MKRTLFVKINLHRLHLRLTFLLLILLLVNIVIGQSYQGSVFLNCRAIPKTSDCKCDKIAMIDFLHMDIIPKIYNVTNTMIDVVLHLEINPEGCIVKFKTNEIDQFNLLETMDYYQKNLGYKIPNFFSDNVVNVQYLLPWDRKADYDLKKIVINKINEDEIFRVLEEMPRFPGCEFHEYTEEKRKCSDKLMKEYISEKIKYPEYILKHKIEGTVVVEFIVDTDGSLYNIQVLRDIGHNSGQSTVDVIDSMNQMSELWISGKQRGVPKKVIYTIPIRFDANFY